MTADSIANVIADLRNGQVRHVVGDERLNSVALSRASTSTIVDSTTIYQSLVENSKPIWIYEDHPNIAPSWESCAVCYVNEHGNVVVMQSSTMEHDHSKAWETENDIRWADVRWIIESFLWLGGKSGDGDSFPTAGPVHLWRYAVYGTGEPADMHWYHIYPQYPMQNWDMAHLVLLGSMNFLACRNIQLIEPHRPRAQQRRLYRQGISIKTISVKPVGKTYKNGNGRRGEPTNMPLTSVRGHFASYGPEYGRGLLFGKLSGRFYIPQHAIGSIVNGQRTNDYELIPD